MTSDLNTPAENTEARFK